MTQLLVDAQGVVGENVSKEEVPQMSIAVGTAAMATPELPATRAAEAAPSASNAVRATLLSVIPPPNPANTGESQSVPAPAAERVFAILIPVWDASF